MILRPIPVATLCGAFALGACDSGPPVPQIEGTTGLMSGQFLVDGPGRHAHVRIVQLHMDNDRGDVRKVVVEDTLTDEHGYYGPIETGTVNGVFLVTARGGEYTDMVTGATIVLDEDQELQAIHRLGLFEERNDVNVSPATHLVAAYARARLAAKKEKTIALARDAAALRLDRHLGNVDWQHVMPADLSQPATSPTEPVRAAVVHHAFSVLANDMAAAAKASPQEVNVMTLVEALAEDIRQDVFDGNDTNDNASGSGLQVGLCQASAACSPPSGCAEGACRTLCDLYRGTLRVLLSQAMSKVVQTETLNQTGLKLPDFAAVIRAVNQNDDVDLFGAGACTETLDRVPPTLVWESPIVPADGNEPWVQGKLALRVRATDDFDGAPVVEWADGRPDEDTGVSVVAATIDTASLISETGTVTVTAAATDLAGNRVESTRVFRVDNTPPTVVMQTTSVANESKDSLFEQFDWAPLHVHTGDGAVTLGAETLCNEKSPQVVKYAYLLDEERPAYGGESKDSVRNPLQWKLQALDDGVGIDPAGTEYRVRLGTRTLVDWHPVPAGASVTGGTEYTVPLYRRVAKDSPWAAIPELGTEEALFAIDFRVRDQLRRTTTTTRCWNHVPLAPPLRGGSAEDGKDGLNPSKDGMYGLGSLRLDQADPVASVLLGSASSGAGVMNVELFNVVAEPIYIRFDLTAPDSASYDIDVVDTWSPVAREGGLFISCGVDCQELTRCTDVPPSDPRCEMFEPARPHRPYTAEKRSLTPVFKVRVWEILPIPPQRMVPLPPVAGTSNTWLLEPRDGYFARYYAVQVVTTMNDRITPDRPSALAQPPYHDDPGTGLYSTGKLGETSTWCTLDRNFHTGGVTCKALNRSTNYAAVKRLKLKFNDPVKMAVKVAPSLGTLTSKNAAARRNDGAVIAPARGIPDWETRE